MAASSTRDRWRSIPAGDLLDAFEAFAEHGHPVLVKQLEDVLGRIDAKTASPGQKAARTASTKLARPSDKTTADVPGNGQGPTRKSETERSKVQRSRQQTLKSERKRQGR